MLSRVLSSVIGVVRRSLYVWFAPERLSRFDLFCFVAINTLLVDLLMGLVAFPYAYITGSPVWLHWMVGAMIATPIAAVLMYLGGNGLRVTLDLRKELEQAHADLEAQANQDFLTGVANRRAYTTALSEKFAKGDTGFSVLMVDLDGFKKINDQYGHDAGDMILVGVAERLSKWLGDYAVLIARLGGDEFAVLLGAETQVVESGIERFGRQLFLYLQLPYAYGDVDLRVGASIGVAHAGPELKDASALTIAADMALREAKVAGKGQVKIYQPKSTAQPLISLRAS